MADSIRIEIYETKRNVCPYSRWESKLDRKCRAQLRTRLNRLRLGNMGDTKLVKRGVRELRVHSGPGYRIYFAVIGEGAVLLLCGGDKATQRRNVDKAVEHWEDYKNRTKKVHR